MDNREFSYQKYLTSERKKVQYIFAKTNLYFCESAVHQIRPEKNRKENCCFKNIFKIIFRMRLKLLRLQQHEIRIIETTFWNYSCWYGNLYRSECNLKTTCNMHKWVFQRRSILHESEVRVRFEHFEKLTSVCFSKLHEKPYYYLLLLYGKHHFRWDGGLRLAIIFPQWTGDPLRKNKRMHFKTKQQN
jgi:hypothetical protein